MKPCPARLHVLLARDVAVGVVIRRGPSKQVVTLLWQRDCDEFTLGQWLRKGRIYERRCDLSPDGEHLLYFAAHHRPNSESGGSWTAISQAPYLKALVMLAKGDCWEGGGLWLGPRKYWLNDRYNSHTTLHDNGQFECEHTKPYTENWGAECLSVYVPRLLRDGWQLVAEDTDRGILEKDLWHSWRLRKIAHTSIDPPVGRGCYWDEHCLVQPANGRLLAYPEWEWAERDRHRLVWAAGGKLFAGMIQEDGLTDVAELCDFNAMVPQRSQVPY